MFSHQFYNILHIVGIVLVMSALGGAAVHAAAGGGRDATRRLLAMLHGGGAFILLVSGFGMLARLGAMHGAFPGWVWVKLVIWVTVAVALMIPFRRPALWRPFLLGLPLLAALAAYMAIYKPF